MVAGTEKSSTTLYEVPFSQPTVIIMGSEESGIDAEILSICDFKAKIPLAGSIKSLNVSTSTGIILYEAVRQRKFDK